MGPNKAFTPQFRLHLRITLAPSLILGPVRKCFIQASSSQLWFWFLVQVLKSARIWSHDENPLRSVIYRKFFSKIHQCLKNAHNLMYWKNSSVVENAWNSVRYYEENYKSVLKTEKSMKATGDDPWNAKKIGKVLRKSPSSSK